MNYLKLTHAVEGTEVYINFDHVISYEPVVSGGSSIYFKLANDKMGAEGIVVKEDVNYICAFFAPLN
ncbi:hypothetical protein PQO03_06445 [Lentisphaera profundi]|uniref:Uncharacterized protein n=1 Tax=Lentisphaera profundi TaxID=1658616 RepID=A0ABY7VN97_9BACT|nr:hypothetical protein [Lentisphaera profundi]WDE95357.1 hypothetical protein PQO03_06445 [Lentisphaera profundi]